MNRCEIIMYWSNDDDCYISEWIETARAEGRSIPVPLLHMRRNGAYLF
ncbi:MAG: hypothetical protein WCR31_11550 [Treponema sp.]